MRQGPFPIWTRWWPTRDWAQTANESNFIMKFSIIQHQHFRKSKTLFHNSRCEERHDGIFSHKNVNNRSAQEIGSFQLEMTMLFIRKNWVKLRWKFDFEETSGEEELKRRKIVQKILLVLLHNARGENGIIMFFSLWCLLEWKFYAKLRVGIDGFNLAMRTLWCLFFYYLHMLLNFLLF